jgi:GTP cyclohydrolase II
VIKNLVKTRLPTGFGEFSIYLYADNGKEHLALVKGEIANKAEIPVRVHSECLTGDVFGSRRCDCGEQLKHSLQYLGRSEAGVLIYLRQEGRGIGLLKKLEAYNLQDQGMDTVEANIHLGHRADERDYGVAAFMLSDLGVRTIRLITNNPQKVEGLRAHGIQVQARIPIEVGHHFDNLGYLKSQAEKMSYQLTFCQHLPEAHELSFMQPLLDQLAMASSNNQPLPFVTLTYAQSMDGSIAVDAGKPFKLSSQQALQLTHFMRAQHDGLLVGVNTILSDDPQLNVRHCDGNDPQPVILDSHLRTPLDSRVLNSGKPPIILTTSDSDPALRIALAAHAAEIIVLDTDPDGCVDIQQALVALSTRGIRTLMVEGGGKIISTFLKKHLVNYCVITITPKFIGGLKAIDGLCSAGDSPLIVTDCRYQPLGSDLIAYGPVNYG